MSSHTPAHLLVVGFVGFSKWHSGCTSLGSHLQAALNQPEETKKMNKLIIGTGFVVLLTIASFTLNLSAQTQQDDDKIPKPAVPTEGFMKVKLKHSANIVEGLALEDFKKITKSAEELLMLSQKADWNTLKTEAYLDMSNEFRASVRRLQKAGTERNLDASTLAYFEVTLSCVRCHKYVRGKK